MLRERILNTLRFFDLQDWPLTLFELHEFLIGDMEFIRQHTDEQGELRASSEEGSNLAPTQVSIDQILKCLEQECQAFAEQNKGFYFLSGRQSLVDMRLANYFFGIGRERRIRSFAFFLRHIPFVRGAALGGSQAMGQQKPASDIDLLIITHPKFLWLARTLVTAYFQLVGKRRHGDFIANRFCLNHYLNHPKDLTDYRNLYTAYEYSRLRPLVYEHAIGAFQKQNSNWIQQFFPNMEFEYGSPNQQSWVQKFFEFCLDNAPGRGLEILFKNLQLPKIRKEKFIVVAEDELSFHPQRDRKSVV